MRKAIFLIITLGMLISYAMMDTSDTSTQLTQQAREISISKSANSDIWKSIDSLEKKGLTQSAIDLLNDYYEQINYEENGAEKIKTVIHLVKFVSVKNENGLVLAIKRLEQETSETEAPTRNVYYSMLAELYWTYYNNNAWKFAQRTSISGKRNDDIETWSVDQILDHVLSMHKKALKNQSLLWSTPIEKYNDILAEGEQGRKFQPTLYDFLANRALQFYADSRSRIHKPVEEFQLKDEVDFATPDQFSNINFSSADDKSSEYNSMKVYVELTRQHIKTKNIDALAHWTIRRLKYVQSTSFHERRDSLFMNGLEQLATTLVHHESSAEAWYELALFHHQQNNNEALNTSSIRAHEICSKTIVDFPKSYGSKLCKQLLSQIEAKELQLQSEHVLIPNKSSLINVRHRNLNKIYFRVVPYSKKWEATGARLGSKDFLRDHLRENPVKSWQTEIKNEQDYTSHSVEKEIPPLPLGRYVILVSEKEDFGKNDNVISCSELWVSNLSMINRRKKDGSLDFHVLDRQSGNPLAGVEITIYRVEYDYKTRANKKTDISNVKSDKNGFFSIQSGERGNNFRVKLQKGEDYIDFPTNYYSYPRNTGKYNLNERRSIFFTDRAIYRPGQIVYFKGIRYKSPEEDPTAATNEEVLVTMYDVNHQEVSKLKLRTNEYGSFSGSFTIPLGLLKGRMLLSDGYGQQYFQVEEYKRPKFEVNFKPVDGMYKLGSNVHLEGTAISYTGIALDDAKVSYRISRTTNFPYWCRYFYPWLPSPVTKEISNGIVKTDKDGTFTIDFKAISDALPNEYAFYSYEVQATVSDVTGETHSANTSVNVGKKALNLKIEIPDHVNLDDKPAVLVKASNLSGQQQKVKGNLKIEKLTPPNRIINQRHWEVPDQFDISQKEFIEKFPHSAYRDENNKYSWPAETEVANIEFSGTDSSGISLNQIADMDEGYYLFTATSVDMFGEEVTAKKIVQCVSLNMKKVPGNEAMFVWPVKSKGEPGEKAIFMVGSQDRSQVLMQVLHRDSSVEKKWIQLNQGIHQIEIPIEEAYRGNFAVQFSCVVYNRRYNESHAIIVPYTNKELKLTFNTFRDVLLPGSKEKWSISIRGPEGHPAMAEMLATLYDASLESFMPHTWQYNIRRNYANRNGWNDNGFFRMANYNWFEYDWNGRVHVPYRTFDKLNWFGFPFYSSFHDYGYSTKAMSGANMSVGILEESEEITDAMDEVKVDANRAAIAPMNKTNLNEVDDPAAMEVRTNFNETAFFYPHLYSEQDGEVEVSFEIPESLTKWKMMGIAHTPDLKFGYLESHLVTKKDLMIEANVPRFVREGDKIIISAKINNLLDTAISAKSGMVWRNAQTGKVVESIVGDTVKVQINASGQREVSWEIQIPDSISLLEYTCWASTETHKDAERKLIPVLSNRMLVTESMPFHIRGNTNVRKSFKKLKESDGSTSLRHHALTLEVTANPAWYVVQALPYLNEYTYPSAELVFGSFYANSLATHIANANPSIKKVFEKWQSFEPDALLSNLEKNQELKSVLLKETPWLLAGQNESEQKRKIALLFQVNSMTQQLQSSFAKLVELQNSNGGWSWFSGMPDNPSVTYRIMTGLGKLDRMGALTIKQNPAYVQMIQSAVRYMDNRIRERYDWIKSHSKNLQDRHISSQEILYLYARSNYLDIQMAEKNKPAYAYFLEQCGKYWLSNNKYVQGMSAVVLHRNEMKETAKEIMASLKENALTSDEMGMYWKTNAGYWWYQAPIDRQAMLIEAFDEVAQDASSVEEMQIWLIKQKQTQHWGNNRSTVEACYALLNRGRDWLSDQGKVEVKLGKQMVLNSKENSESGTGYSKKMWNSSSVKSEMGDIQVSKKDNGIAWGSVYWQYFEDLNNITSHDTPLSLKKDLFKEVVGNAGKTLELIEHNGSVNVGDRITVRVELRVDRDMEFVHMKDMRSAGLEPINVISQYKFQDGLGYYESTSDVATDFFMDYLRKGTYVFEYQLIATIAGEFSNGISQIQCLYAPEFMSHSQGQKLRITQ